MVKFYLDKKGDKESLIFLDLSLNGKRFRMFTGKRILPDHWDPERCRANPRKYKNNPIGFNKFLQDIEDQVICLRNSSEAIDKEKLVAMLNKLQGKGDSASLLIFAAEYLDTQLNKGSIRLSTYKNHKVTLNYLKNHFPNLDFDGVTVRFYDTFVAFLRRKGLANNAIGRHIKSIKWFMRAGFDRGLHSNMDFTKSSFKVLKEETDAVYLTPHEISKLLNAELPERYRRVADAFVINCRLGLRYHDQIHILKSNFREEGPDTFLVLVQGKTSELVSIPVPKDTLALLEKYEFNCPLIKNSRLMSGQKFNDYIKEACELAHLDAPVTLRSCGKTLTGPKFQYVKSHTARRSFATNLYDQGVPSRSIMAVTGHKKEQTFLLYIKSDQLAKAKSLAMYYQSLSEKPGGEVKEASHKLTA